MSQTFRERYRMAGISWQDKATTINLYHVFMTTKDSNWKVMDTARYFDLSMGSVSEAMKIAEHIEHVRDCRNRKEALIKLKEMGLT